MSPLHKFIKYRTALIKRHNEAWELVNYHHNKYVETKITWHLTLARKYLQVGLTLQEFVA